MIFPSEGEPRHSVKLLPCDHEVMGSSPGNSLAEMQGKATHIRPKVTGPFPGLAQAGATCTGLPFFEEIFPSLTCDVLGANPFDELQFDI
jgi:hypothetical protein